jgi:hypothetical protein
VLEGLAALDALTTLVTTCVIVTIIAVMQSR